MSRRPNEKFDDGALVRPDFRDTGRKVSPRKLAQLCSQIRRALQMAVLGTVEDETFIDLEVHTVEPGNDPGRVRVVFFHHDASVELNEVRRRVEAARGLWTAEVARAIHRRKVPELVFEVHRPSPTDDAGPTPS